jgi:hypothetical protein
VPLSALFAALFDGPEPLLDRRALRHLHSLPEQRYWMLEELAALLEQAALDAPLLLCHDDMQWADGACLAGVRTLPPRLIALRSCGCSRSGQIPRRLMFDTSYHAWTDWGRSDW